MKKKVITLITIISIVVIWIALTKLVIELPNENSLEGFWLGFWCLVLPSFILGRMSKRDKHIVVYKESNEIKKKE